MKYIKNSKNFKSTSVKKTNEKLNINLHKTQIKKLGDLTLPDPEHGDLKLSVMPFENNGKWISLPEGFKMWEKSLNEVVKLIPLQEGANTHYVTIDTKFFTKDEYLRREGVHADGNFCVDPKFITEREEFKASWGGSKPTWGGARLNDETDTEEGSETAEREFKASWGGATPKPTWGGAKLSDKENEFKASWGGSKPTWGGSKIKEYAYEAKEDNRHVKMDWVLPYKLTIPIGDYISEKKGGIITVSNEVGCQAWGGEFYGEILSEGAYTDMENQLTEDKKVILEKNGLYFMTSNTPHETLLISKGKRRTFMRITLNHNYLNESILKK